MTRWHRQQPIYRHLGRIGDVLSPPTTAPTAARPLLNLSLALNFAGDDVSRRGTMWSTGSFMSAPGSRYWESCVARCSGRACAPATREVALPLAAYAALLWTLHPLQTNR